MDIQPFIAAIQVADPPYNTAEHARPDPVDVHLASLDFPLLKALAKGMDADSSDETRGRLAAYYLIYATLAGEFGDTPLGTLDLEGPTGADQGAADEALSDEASSTDLVGGVLRDFPALGTTIQRIEKSEFHTGVLVAYCATWIWLQRLAATRGPVLRESTPDVEDPLAGFDDYSEGVEADDNPPPDSGPGPGPVSSGLGTLLHDLTQAGLSNACLQLAPPGAACGLNALQISASCRLEPAYSCDGQILDVAQLYALSRRFEQATGSAPTVLLINKDQVRFQALIEPEVTA